MKQTIICFLVTVQMLTAAGGSSFEFLAVPVGGIASSMGNASAAASDGIEGAYHNPATMTSLDREYTAMGYYNFYCLASLWGAGFAWQGRDFGAVTAVARGISHDAITGDIMFNGDAGKLFDAAGFAATLAYALPVGRLAGFSFDLDLGASGTYVQENFDGISIACGMMDAGFRVRFFDGLFSTGAVVKNIGLWKNDASVAVPMQYAVGIASELRPAPFVALMLRADGTASDAFSTFSAGSGCSVTIFNLVSFRGGVSWVNERLVLSAGGSLMFSVGDGASLALHYAFIPLSDAFGYQNNIQITIGFGGSTSPLKKAGGVSRIDQGTDRPVMPAVESSIEPVAVTDETAEREKMNRGVAYAREKKYHDAIQVWKTIDPRSVYYEKSRAFIERVEKKIAAAAAIDSNTAAPSGE